MTLTCPDHGRVQPRLAWCRSDDGRLHLGGRCPAGLYSDCNLWLKWLRKDTKGAPMAVRIEALR